MDQLLILKIIFSVIGLYISIATFKLLFNIIRVLVITIIQFLVGILDVIVNSLRWVYNLFVAKNQKLPPISFPKLIN